MPPPQTIALTVNPVAPALTAPSSLSVKEDGAVALGISETAFDSRDLVSITIAGVPADATLSAGSKGSNGIWTLSPGQLSGLTLTAGEVTTANLTITATNTQGAGASTTQSIALTVDPVAPALTAPSSLSVKEDGAVALSASARPRLIRATWCRSRLPAYRPMRCFPREPTTAAAAGR